MLIWAPSVQPRGKNTHTFSELMISWAMCITFFFFISSCCCESRNPTNSSIPTNPSRDPGRRSGSPPGSLQTPVMDPLPQQRRPQQHAQANGCMPAPSPRIRMTCGVMAQPLHPSLGQWPCPLPPRLKCGPGAYVHVRCRQLNSKIRAKRRWNNTTTRQPLLVTILGASFSLSIPTTYSTVHDKDARICVHILEARSRLDQKNRESQKLSFPPRPSD